MSKQSVSPLIISALSAVNAFVPFLHRHDLEYRCRQYRAFHHEHQGHLRCGVIPPAQCPSQSLSTGITAFKINPSARI